MSVGFLLHIAMSKEGRVHFPRWPWEGLIERVADISGQLGILGSPRHNGSGRKLRHPSYAQNYHHHYHRHRHHRRCRHHHHHHPINTIRKAATEDRTGERGRSLNLFVAWPRKGKCQVDKEHTSAWLCASGSQDYEWQYRK